MFAKLFATIIQRRLASWAEVHGIKASGQAGFQKNYRTTDNNCVRRSLIDKQKQARQKGGSGKLCCYVYFKKALDTVLRAVLWQTWVWKGAFWSSSSLCMHMTALQYAHQKDFLRSSDVLWESSQGVP